MKWHLEVTSDGWDVVDDGGGRVVATVWGRMTGTEHRLIAKAPDMLAFLVRFASDYAPSPTELCRMRSEARAIIEKED